MGGERVSRPAPYHADALTTLYLGDCREVMRAMEAGSVDAVVCDPPYGLEFMGAEWDRLWTPAKKDKPEGHMGSDGVFRRKTSPVSRNIPRPSYVAGIAAQAWHESWLVEAYRVLRPGGVLLAMGGTRTFHRLACAIEDAGFAIFDHIFEISAGPDPGLYAWVHAQGFPKHKNLLKPSIEPIVCAKKPGPGGLDTEAGRLGGGKDVPASPRRAPQNQTYGDLSNDPGTGSGWDPSLGRYPPNLAFSHHPDCIETGVRRVRGSNKPGRLPKHGALGYHGADGGMDAHGFTDPDGTETVPAFSCHPSCPVRLLDEMAGERTSHGGGTSQGMGYGSSPNGVRHIPLGDTGGASRFYFCSKAPARERVSADDGTRHPTQKPLDLMRWLVRMACPPGGVLLDPFAGSGTTLVAARLEGRRCVGVELDARYREIAAKRLAQAVLPLEVPA